MNNKVAVYDACVLFSSPIRDLLMYLFAVDVVEARWSKMIQWEWMRSVLRRGLSHATQEQLKEVRNAMNLRFSDGLVDDFKHLIKTLQLRDPDDRHVLAAAIQSKADWIVTFNLKDFPSSVLSCHHIEALSPDNFIGRLIEADITGVLDAANQHRIGLKRPPKTVDEYLASLEKHCLPKTAAFLREHRSEI